MDKAQSSSSRGLRRGQLQPRRVSDHLRHACVFAKYCSSVLLLGPRDNLMRQVLLLRPGEETEAQRS